LELDSLNIPKLENDLKEMDIKFRKLKKYGNKYEGAYN